MNENFAGLRSVHTEQQLHQSAFTDTGDTFDRDKFSLIDREGGAVQHNIPIKGKADLIKADRFHVTIDLSRVYIAVKDLLIRHVFDLHDPFGRRQRVEISRKDIRHALDRGTDLTDQRCDLHQNAIGDQTIKQIIRTPSESPYERE